MQPPPCIEGGVSPCPTCPVSSVCPWGKKLLIRDPEKLRIKLSSCTRGDTP